MSQVLFTPQSFQLIHQLAGTLTGAASGGLPYDQARSSLGRILSDPSMREMKNAGALPYQVRGVERFIGGENCTATRLTALAMRFSTFREALKSRTLAAIPTAPLFIDALGQLHSVLQAHLGGTIGGDPEALDNLLRFQIGPHLKPLRESQILGETVLLPLDEFAAGGDLAPEIRRDIARRVQLVHGLLVQADTPGFQADQFARTDPRALRRTTGIGPSISPSSRLAAGAAPTAQTTQKSHGQYVRAAIIETDFASFEEKSGRVRAAELTVQRLNLYYGRLQDVLRAHGMIQDNFIGDAILAYCFDKPNNAECAVRCALDMQEEIRRINRSLREAAIDSREFQDKLRQAGKTIEELSPEELESLIAEVDPIIFEMRVGVNIGVVNLALLGKPEFFQKLTIIGSPVNTAARLESRCPLGGVCGSDAVLGEFPQGMLEVTPLGVVQVKKNVFNAHHITAIRNIGAAPRKGKVILPLQGRDKDVQMILNVLANSIAYPRPEFVLMEAKAGEGKSAIADTVMESIKKKEKETEDPAKKTLILYDQGDLRPELEPNYFIKKILRRQAGLQKDDREELRSHRIRSLAASADTDSGAHLLALFLDEPLPNPPPEIEYLMKNPEEFQKRTQDFLVRLYSGISRERPVFLVMDDMQWIDAESLEKVHSLLTQLKKQGRPFTVLALRRKEEKMSADREPNWFGKLYSSQLIDLEPLEPQYLEAIAGKVLGDQTSPELIQEILARSEGNPLFAQEIAVAAKRGLAMDQIPGTVVELYQSQFEQLDEPHFRLLKVAAVIGRDFTEGDLTGMGIAEPANLAPLLIERDFILRAAGKGDLQFRHDTVRQAVRKRMEESEARGLHGAYAKHLVDSGSEDWALIASHFREGGEMERAARYYLTAADAARKSGEFEAAITFYERVLELSPADGPKIEALLGLSAVYYSDRSLDPRYERTVSTLEKITPLFDHDPSAVPRTHRALYHFYKGRALNRSGRRDEAREELRQGLELYQEEEIEEPRFHLLNEMGTISFYTNDTDRAVDFHSRALTAARRLGQRDLVAYASGNLAIDAYQSGRYSECRQRAIEAAEICKAREDWRDYLTARNMGAMALVNLGDYERGLEILTEAIEISRERARNFYLSTLMANLGVIKRLTGKPHEAIACHEEALRLRAAELDSANKAINCVYLSFAMMAHGDLSGAAGNAALALGIADKLKDPALQAMVSLVLSEIQLAQGNRVEALNYSEKTVENLHKAGFVEDFHFEILWNHAQILHQMGRNREALEAIREARTALQDRARLISDESHRQKFLHRVRVNREIENLYHLLAESAEHEISDELKGFLGSAVRRLDLPEKLEPELRFLEEPANGEWLPSPAGPVKVWRRNGDVIAGVSVNRPAGALISRLFLDKIIVPRNPGPHKGEKGEALFEARDVALRLNVDKGGNPVARVKFTLASEAHPLLLRAIQWGGRIPSEIEVTLRGSIVDRGGAIAIEFETEQKESILQKGILGQDLFGKISFHLAPRSDGGSFLSLVFQVRDFTIHPENFMRAIMVMIAGPVEPVT